MSIDFMFWTSLVSFRNVDYSPRTSLDYKKNTLVNVILTCALRWIHFKLLEVDEGGVYVLLNVHKLYIKPLPYGSSFLRAAAYAWTGLLIRQVGDHEPCFESPIEQIPGVVPPSQNLHQIGCHEEVPCLLSATYVFHTPERFSSRLVYWWTCSSERSAEPEASLCFY